VDSRRFNGVEYCVRRLRADGETQENLTLINARRAASCVAVRIDNRPAAANRGVTHSDISYFCYKDSHAAERDQN
jgi:hypothetical protein